MPHPDFTAFFSGTALDRLTAAIDLALVEDGPDLTSDAVFSPEDRVVAVVVAKQHTLVAGLPIAPIILDRCPEVHPYTLEMSARDGDRLAPGETALRVTGSARHILKAERVILNFMTHLSGIANLTHDYVTALEGTHTRLLDTRKTLPGLRHVEKYAVLVGGGLNHRIDLAEMLMLKDNHIDAAGSITAAVTRLRTAYAPCPPIEVECRTMEEVAEAVACHVDRIMLDNMTPEAMRAALGIIPRTIETETSGGVTLETIRSLALVGDRGPDFISVGRLTHSAPAADFSMRISKEHP